MYKYIGNTGKRIKVDAPAGSQGNNHRVSQPISDTKNNHHVEKSIPPTPKLVGLSSFLNSLLPVDLDTGDILLLLLFFLLYLDSRDEDFLIILAVLGFSMFTQEH